MRSKVQDVITLYLTQLGYDPDTTYLRYDGDSTVTVETPEGSRKLTVSLYEDILEIRPEGTLEVIAESDLPHEGFPHGATKWTEKGGESE